MKPKLHRSEELIQVLQKANSSITAEKDSLVQRVNDLQARISQLTQSDELAVTQKKLQAAKERVKTLEETVEGMREQNNCIREKLCQQETVINQFQTYAESQT